MRVTLFAVLTALAALAMAQQRPDTMDRPSVVLIMTDDVGYGDLGSYGAPDVRTPVLDALAADGIRLTDFYANGPACSPTRAGMMTGRYQQRVGIERPLGHAASADPNVGLLATGVTVPQLLKDNGYATALIGKWHLGHRPEFSPNAHGFDYFFGYKSGYIDYYQHTDGAGDPDLFENDRPVKADGYLTDRITEHAVSYIRDHARQPFFLSVQYSAAHWPYQRPDQPSVARDHARHLQPYDEQTSTRADYVAVLERADQGIGEILQALADAGIADDTLVIYSNDNGGEWLARNEPLFHRKMTVWEGGIRVPAIVRWPGHIPAGRVSDQVGITMDLTASILAATHTPVPDAVRLEGINLLPILEGTAPELERTLFWRSGMTGQRQSAVRSGDWKLVVDGGATLLFNLRTDIGEHHDLASQRPDVARRLRPLLDVWAKDVDAERNASGAGGTPVTNSGGPR